MSFDEFDNYECEGQLTLWDIDIPESLFAVSKIFARARKQMNLPEFKAFTFALSNLRFTEKNPNKIRLDKKTLAKIVGVNSDADHLSQDLKRSIGELPKHSYIEICDEDMDFYESGVVITSLRMYKNNACITFNPDYMPLFSGLERDYITMWSGDIYGMSSERSIAFYEELRLNSDTRTVNSKGFGIKALKELLGIPKDGPGSYMRTEANGGFDRTNFEKRILQPLVEDLKKCKMINLIMQEDGKYYEKVKRGNRVLGYRFYWEISSHPAVATAEEVFRINDEISKNPQVLKVAKDIVEGSKKPSNNSFNNYEQRNYDESELSGLEAALIHQSLDI